VAPTLVDIAYLVTTYSWLRGVPEFGGRSAGLTFVAVHCSSVDVPVADPQRGAHRVFGFRRWDLENAEFQRSGSNYRR
jgi:hypothetical protein